MPTSDREVGAVYPYFNDDVSDTKVLVKSGNQLIYGYELHNVSAADAFLLLFDAASTDDVTLGTTVPDYVIPNGANAIKERSLSKPMHFKLGIVIASTTTTDGSTGAAQDVSLDIT